MSNYINMCQNWKCVISALCPAFVLFTVLVWQFCWSIPFIKGNIHYLSVLSLEVKHIEHEHKDHTAGCGTEGWLLKVLLYPASHTQTKTLHFLSAYHMRCVLVLAEKERPPAGPRGLGISASPPTAVHHSSLYCFLFIFYHPTPILKEGRAPTICLTGSICVLVSWPGTQCGAGPSAGPSD